ncbi:ER membrane protein complex subunit 4 [Apophysomyces ossiformis]|uniref:ER membrane protein complex subunit 4 n=1 Tax=Apophysomyces ossiformis TaxID=679940 RepID=A0A8H7BZD2_9FUNG|nr:ER membrane protein complex subunit 4 [Apophysomyces ossiformis]
MSKWAIDYASINANARLKLPSPVGFNSAASQSSKAGSRAWDVAMSPAKNIPMNAIMIYMTGNGVQIFSVMITFMLFFQPAKAIMSIQQAFERFESTGASRSQPGADLLLPKLAFIALHVLTMLLGIYKVNAMGLLPTTTSDWLAFLQPKENMPQYNFERQRRHNLQSCKLISLSCE